MGVAYRAGRGFSGTRKVKPRCAGHRFDSKREIITSISKQKSILSLPASAMDSHTTDSKKLHSLANLQPQHIATTPWLRRLQLRAYTV